MVLSDGRFFYNVVTTHTYFASFPIFLLLFNPVYTLDIRYVYEDDADDEDYGESFWEIFK